MKISAKFSLNFGDELGDHVELGEEDVSEGVGLADFCCFMDDLYLYIWYFLHAEDMISWDFQDHLFPEVHEFSL